MDYQIFNEDCLEGMKNLPDGLIDLTVTSPPYDNLRTYDGYNNAWQFEPIANELFRVTKHGGVVVWVVGDASINNSETGTSFRQALYFKDIGFKLYDTMIYQKTGAPPMASNRYYQGFEYMFVLSKGDPKTVNLLCDRKNNCAGKVINGASLREIDGSLTRKKTFTIAEYGKRFNIWQYKSGFNGDRLRHEHPATFPDKLAEDHIKSWSNEGDTVLDPFAGSGTTGVACVNLNRNFIGYEIHPKYSDLCHRRIDEAIAKREQSLF